MMRAVNPYSGNSSSKAEILARYRPIAPKPEAAPSSPTGDGGPNALPENIRRSAFLRNVWPHLQARPTRTRKRGRSAFTLPPVKRTRACMHGLTPLTYQQVFNSSANPWPNYNGFPQIPTIRPNLDSPATAPAEDSGGRLKGIDLNREAEIPEEIDFMPQLQGVITPQPVRLVGSTIFIGCIIHTSPPESHQTELCTKTPSDVETEAETITLPVVISDVHNKVRLANTAYNEMVGQPECRWLDRLVSNNNQHPYRLVSNNNHHPCKRICGEVMIQFSETFHLPISSNKFTCWVKIEWNNNNGEKKTVRAFCDAVKLACQSKDYLFQWRFHVSDNSSAKSARFQQR